MWVLLLMIMTVEGTVIAYDQGRYDSFEECTSMGLAMVSELEGNYIHNCIEWKEK
jgi:hypothetical protein